MIVNILCLIKHLSPRTDIYWVLLLKGCSVERRMAAYMIPYSPLGSRYIHSDVHVNHTSVADG